MTESGFFENLNAYKKEIGLDVTTAEKEFIKKNLKKKKKEKKKVGVTQEEEEFEDKDENEEKEEVELNVKVKDKKVCEAKEEMEENKVCEEKVEVTEPKACEGKVTSEEKEESGNLENEEDVNVAKLALRKVTTKVCQNTPTRFITKFMGVIS